MPNAAERDLLRCLKPGLRILDHGALNAEATPDLLDKPLTPIPAFFVRNNGLLPELPVTAEQWTLTVDGEVDVPHRWSIEALRSEFETVSVTAVLECAGNGRSGFVPPTEGLPWTVGAVGCARWTGVRLRDLLRACGVRQSAVYTGHHSPDVQVDGSGRPALSRGLPIAKALAPETLVAFAMNGEPLPLLHGGPLRIVAPGYPGSAWQKWLSGLTVREREHDGTKMTGTDYRLPVRPLAPGEPVDPADFAVITDMPVKSLITFPRNGFTVPVGASVAVRGFAWSGQTPVASLDLSADGGSTWCRAELEPEREPFAWRRFQGILVFEREGPAVVIARARDAAGRTQPLDSAAWNPGGYCNNGVHRVTGTVQGLREQA
ncbi:sulfite oxidase [Microvirga massiliensis]|uniref:sulfite oxidase n=1 Tax=Microvirga massiliensis TaxID=1033741 RepID=UPI00062B406F|nr:sulfite oxidase [Microvirga massiliensis]